MSPSEWKVVLSHPLLLLSSCPGPHAVLLLFPPAPVLLPAVAQAPLQHAVARAPRQERSQQAGRGEGRQTGHQQVEREVGEAEAEGEVVVEEQAAGGPGGLGHQQEDEVGEEGGAGLAVAEVGGEEAGVEEGQEEGGEGGVEAPALPVHGGAGGEDVELLGGVGQLQDAGEATPGCGGDGDHQQAAARRVVGGRSGQGQQQEGSHF